MCYNLYDLEESSEEDPSHDAFALVASALSGIETMETDVKDLY